MRIQPVALVLLAAAVVFVVLGILYITQTANDLPGFLPGATDPKFPECGDVQPGELCFEARAYTKRGIAAFGAAAVCLVGMWYTSGLRRSSSSAGE
jgi:hypothetical protein